MDRSTSQIFNFNINEASFWFLSVYPWQKAPSASNGKYKFSGDITVYAPSPNGGNCGYPKFSEGAKKYFVALPKVDYDNSLNCGRCIEAKCTAGNVGTNCDNGEPTIMMVTDSCPECHSGDLDLSYAAWDKITGGAGHSRFKADWKYVPCPDSFLVTKTISFYIKPGSSRWWFAVMPMGSKSKVKDVKVNRNGRWESMKTGEIDSYYYLAKGLSILPSNFLLEPWTKIFFRPPRKVFE